MANYTISPNMNLVVPTVGLEPGPQFATDINNSLTIIDAHNHTAGNGVQLTQASLNINGSLTLNQNALLASKYLAFSLQTTAPTASTAPDSLYADGSGNLHYINNTADIQITSGNALNVTSSGISSGTATASFISSVLTVFSNASNSTPANIQGGSLLLGNNVSNSKYITLQPPSSLGANYTLTLPLIGASQSLLTMDTAGNITPAIPNSTLTVASGSVTVATQGITATQIANATITSTQIATNGIAPSNLPLPNYIISSGLTGTHVSGNPATDLGGVSLTVSGVRPVLLFLVSNTLSTPGYLNSPMNLYIKNITTGNATASITITGINGTAQFLQFFDTSAIGVASGTTLSWHVIFANSNGTSSTVNNVQLVAYEL